MRMHLSSLVWVMQVIATLAHKTFTALLLSIGIVASLISCGTELSEEQTQQVDEALKDSLTSSTETWGMDMEIIEDGEKKIRMLGSYATTMASGDVNETRIEGPVTIHVFDSTGTITTNVESNRAVYRPDDSIFELYGEVIVVTSNNRELESEYLEWHQDDNTLNTPKFVIIKTPTDSLAGTGFEGTTDLLDFTIREPKGRVIVD